MALRSGLDSRRSGSSSNRQLDWNHLLYVTHAGKFTYDIWKRWNWTIGLGSGLGLILARFRLGVRDT
jgi:hypothetical protein